MLEDHADPPLAGVLRVEVLVVETHRARIVFFSSRRRHTRSRCDWSSDVCSSDLADAFGRDADDEAVGRELAALGDNGSGGDDRALTDLRAVEDGTSHPYETIVLDLAPVHDRVVAENASLANDSGEAGVGVEDAAVLHVGPSPDTDGLRVATQHGSVPDARFSTQVDVPDDTGSRRDPGRPRDLRESIAVRKQVTFLVQIQRGVPTLYSMYSSANLRSR